jgi:hypothetical protein
LYDQVLAIRYGRMHGRYLLLTILDTHGKLKVYYDCSDYQVLA